MSGRSTAVALLPTFAAACATTEGPRPLTLEALEHAKIACAAPDAELRTDDYHVKIVLNGYTPDRRRQVTCLFEQLQGYAFDQIITSRPPPDDPGQ